MGPVLMTCPNLILVSPNKLQSTHLTILLSARVPIWYSRDSRTWRRPFWRRCISPSGEGSIAAQGHVPDARFGTFRHPTDTAAAGHGTAQRTGLQDHGILSKQQPTAAAAAGNDGRR